MAGSIQVEVITPRENLISQEAICLTIPGAEGEMKVHPEHQPLLTSLRPGRFVVHSEDGDQLYYLAGGFAEILGDRVILLADECLTLDQIDKELAISELDIAEKALEADKHKSTEELAGEFLARDRALARIALLDGESGK